LILGVNWLDSVVYSIIVDRVMVWFGVYGYGESMGVWNSLRIVLGVGDFDCLCFG
jgi:hypothetical protein